MADGVTGFLVPPDDHGALAERLAHLITHPDDYHAMSTAGPVVAEERIDIVRFAERLESAYAESAASQRAAAAVVQHPLPTASAPTLRLVPDREVAS